MRTPLFSNLANIGTVEGTEHTNGRVELDLVRRAVHLVNGPTTAQRSHVTGDMARQVVALLDQFVEVDDTRGSSAWPPMLGADSAYIRLVLRRAGAAPPAGGHEEHDVTGHPAAACTRQAHDGRPVCFAWRPAEVSLTRLAPWHR